MKKFFFVLAAVTVATVAAITISSCKKGTDGSCVCTEKNTGVSQAMPTYATYSCKEYQAELNRIGGAAGQSWKCK